jgi:hypothetical protein
MFPHKFRILGEMQQRFDHSSPLAERNGTMKSTRAFFCILVAVVIAAPSAQTWTDVTSSFFAPMNFNPASCTGGPRVDRLTGDAIIGVCYYGLWKSTDKGATWTILENKLNSGGFEFSEAFDVDQNNPKRMGCFSVHGTGAWTSDGKTWIPVMPNLDLGSVDWSSSSPKTIMVSQHESGGAVWLSTDGAATWKKLSIAVSLTGGGANELTSMLGVLDSVTLVYCNGSGIYRSTNAGADWTKVSNLNPQTKAPILFSGVYYLGTSAGLLVSNDKGATWQPQGTSLNIDRGPLFGADENTMVVQTNSAVYKTTNKGSTWSRIAGFPPSFNATHYGGIAWDPINDILYGIPAYNATYKLQLSPSSTKPLQPNRTKTNRISIVNATVRSEVPFDKIELFSLSGTLLYSNHGAMTNSAGIPSRSMLGAMPSIVRIATAKGFVSTYSR